MSEKLWMATDNPNKKVWYRSTIIDRGGDGPVFRVVSKDRRDLIWEGTAPSSPWLAICREIRDKSGRPAAASGPECFGLANPQVHEWLSRLPNAEKCKNYMMPERTADPAVPEREEEEKPNTMMVDFGKLLRMARMVKNRTRKLIDHESSS
jgi:hypothetical protein